MANNKQKGNIFRPLTWDELQGWAGSRVLSRGQSYQRSRRVSNLVQTEDGDLIAWGLGGASLSGEKETSSNRSLLAITWSRIDRKD